jgi:hypothetical protein
MTDLDHVLLAPDVHAVALPREVRTPATVDRIAVLMVHGDRWALTAQHAVNLMVQLAAAIYADAQGEPTRS